MKPNLNEIIKILNKLNNTPKSVIHSSVGVRLRFNTIMDFFILDVNKIVISVYIDSIYSNKYTLKFQSIEESAKIIMYLIDCYI